MRHLAVLVLLTVFLCLQLKKILDRIFFKEESNYERTKCECDNLKSENKRIKEDNLVLEKTAEETIALYDITKEICKSLDEDKVFSHFYDLINRYIKVSDCKFIKDEAELSQYNNYTILPLHIDKNMLVYLAASQIKEQDRERFHILAGQLLLGVKRAVLYQKVQALAITDSLTGIFSRRYLLERFHEEVERSKKFKYNFCFLMVDIDHFKDYNDRYGHLVGDAILREVSKTIRENIRQIDLVGRYGGEEFSIILSETDKFGARFTAERIRQAVEYKNIRVYDEVLRVTISIGVSIFPEDTLSPQMLIDKADQALYRAKQAGRNRVCIYEK